TRKSAEQVGAPHSRSSSPGRNSHLSPVPRRDGVSASQTVPLRAILARRDLALDTLVPAAPDAQVRWATVSELLDPAPYLRGGELLLTAGTNLPEESGTLAGYVAALSAGGGAPLGFGVTPVPGTVPAALVRHRRARGPPPPGGPPRSTVVP